MEQKNIPLKDIKIDSLAKELASSEGTRPYVDYFKKAYSNDAAGVEAALEVLRDLPLEQRYTWRVFSALKWAFADFDDEMVRLDLAYIPDPKRSEIVRELELRSRQFQLLLRVFSNDNRKQ